MRNLSGLVISGSGVFVPSQTINNEELVASFNEYVHRFNREHAAEIAAGSRHALLESSCEFIVKASGIRNRFVLDKAGILDPAVMCPRLPERPDGELSVMAEMAVAAAREAMAAAEKKPEDIDAVICACAALPRLYPALTA